MAGRQPMPPTLILLAAVLLSACSASEAEPPTAAPTPVEEGLLDLGEVLEAEPIEEEPSLEERWRAPFAVSSSGQVRPRQPRGIVVIGADPEIAAGLAGLHDSSGEPEPSPERGPGSEAAPTTARTHRVEPGETIWGIARRYNMSAERLQAVNDLEDEVLRVGQRLIIPAPATP